MSTKVYIVRNASMFCEFVRPYRVLQDEGVEGDPEVVSFRTGRVILLGLPPLPRLVDVIGTGKLGSSCGRSLMLIIHISS